MKKAKINYRSPKSFRNKLRYSNLVPAVVLMVVFGVVGVYALRNSFAAITIKGTVYDTRTGKGIPNVVIFGCNSNGQTKTRSDGTWSLIAVNSGYCARVLSGIPSGYTGPATNNRPEHATSTTYEAQHAGKDCYHNSTCTGSEVTWDRAVDTGVDFRYTSPVPPPTTKVCWDGKTYPIAQACPAQPSPTPKPTPKPPTKTAPKTITTPNTADTTSPTAPQNLAATLDDTTQTIHLTWQASTDNKGVVAYQLERSSDTQQNWDLVSNSITQTSYDDLTAGFGTTYYYRLKAVDAAGNVSDYAATQVNTGTFESNAKSGSDTNITSDDKVVTVFIPAGALSQDAFCSITLSTDTQLPKTTKYLLISGPYILSCRDHSGNSITTFNKPFVLSAHVDSSSLNGIKQVIYLGQKDDSSWHDLKITKHDKKSSTDTVNLENYRTFSIMGSKKKTPLWVKILEILAILIALLFLTRFVVRLLLKRKAVNDYDEYLRKAKGL